MQSKEITIFFQLQSQIVELTWALFLKWHYRVVNFISLAIQIHIHIHCCLNIIILTLLHTSKL